MPRRKEQDGLAHTRSEPALREPVWLFECSLILHYAASKESRASRSGECVEEYAGGVGVWKYQDDSRSGR